LGNINKINLLDDSCNESIGLIVRKDFCTAIVAILQNGLFTSRFAGLRTFTVWDLIRAASPRPDASASAAMVTAFRVCMDLNGNVNMQHDPHIKTRSFICASLNHHFLEDWLQGLSANAKLLERNYADSCFLRTCPPFVMRELLLSLQPLMVLPFRLHTQFEITRRFVEMRRCVHSHVGAVPGLSPTWLPACLSAFLPACLLLYACLPACLQIWSRVWCLRVCEHPECSTCAAADTGALGWRRRV